MPEFDLSSALKHVAKKNPKLVAIQVPEGLKQQLPKIIEEVEKTGTKAISFIEPCFGACDLKDLEAKELGADLLVHFGHLQFVSKNAVETIYISIEYKVDEKAVSLMASNIAKELRGKGFGKIALCGTIQFGKHIELLKKDLGKKGFAVLIGKGKSVEQGQVLGCNYSSVKGIERRVEAVVFVGDGLFHPLGLSFAVSKPVFVANPVEGEVKLISGQKDLFLRKRIAMIEKVRQAKTVAIWVSTKRGQQRIGLAKSLKEKFEKRGKKAFLFASDLIKPEYLLGIESEAIVCTACSRIAFDDSSLFKQAIVNPIEAMIALGEKKLENYAFDELC